MMPVSIKHIARLAGVSPSTVSRALSKSPLIRPSTAARIWQIASASGYTVNAVGRSLVTGKTRTIGVVVTSIADPFVAEVVGGIEEVCNKQGFSVILACAQTDPDIEIGIVQSFRERRVDGIVVTASRVGALYLALMSEMKVPLVLVNHFSSGQFVQSVMIDNVSGAREATRHLIKLGHRRIAYLGDQSGLQSDTDRFSGYRQALGEADIPFDSALLTHGDGKPQGAAAPIQKLLSLAERPTAVFCYNDMSALGALQAVLTRGLHVPRDISLVGVDDLFIASYTQPPLTTLRQPMNAMGQQAMKVLLKLLSGERSEHLILVKGELIVRASTAPPPA
jgi:DNA-binding LacI/PurR family transcriptional regulator